MITFRDSLTLSLTKLRTRKVRLLVTVLVSGLLFCGLAAASLVARGVFNSVDTFTSEGFGRRFIVSGNYQDDYTKYQDAKVLDRALAIQKDLVARKKATAKSLGIEYDAAHEPSPVQEFDAPGGKQRNLDLSQPSAQQAVKELISSTEVTSADMAKQAAAYHGSNTYESLMYMSSNDGSSLQVLKQGKESFATSAQPQNGPPTGTDSFTTMWTLMSGDLLKPFLLKNTSLDDKGDGTIPIIVPVSAAEQLLGLKSLPDSATPVQKLDRMKALRSQAAALTFKVCYRNGTSSGLISAAQSTAQEIEQNAKNKDYQKPELIYGLPTQPCGASPITRDVRDADTKIRAAKQEQFDVLYGKQPTEQHVLQFRVVGMSPDQNYGAAFGVSQIVSSLVTSSLGAGWFTPQEYKTKVPLINTLFSSQNAAIGVTPQFYEEFPTAADAKKFIDEKGCQPQFANGPQQTSSDPFVQCNKEGKLFSLSPYGSNSLALDSAKKDFSRIFAIAALVGAVIAAIIMMGTVGRMIADSRRETAVFRAIGAKKIDIAQVYILYTILLAILIYLFVLGLGMAVAAYVDYRYSPQATVQALVAYNAQDLTRKFTLFHLFAADMLRLAGLILAASITSSILPLIRNLRRNPIRDMRDDT